MKNGIYKIRKLKKQKIVSLFWIYLLTIFNFIILFSFFSPIKGILNSEIHIIIEGSGIQQIINKDFNPKPNEVLVNGILDSCNYRCDLKNNGLNNITLKFNQEIATCKNMFGGCSQIIEIDLSNFDSSNVKNMNKMFYGCKKLTKINFGNINTSSVEDMSSMFFECESLKFIDLSKFDTSSVTNMEEMFKRCRKLRSIDLSSFNTSKVENMFDLFNSCGELLTANLSSFDTSKVTKFHGIFSYCKKLIYLDLKNFDGSSCSSEFGYMFDSCELVYLNMKSFKIIGTNVKNTNTAPKELEYFCVDDTTIKDILAIHYTHFNCSNICFEENIKIDQNQKKCIKSCSDNNFLYEYNNICMNECPEGTQKILKNEIICSEIIPENYYLEINSNIYKECYNTCKRCNGTGNETNNNCYECIDDFIFLTDSFANKNNCYKKCKFYYYFDENNNYKCTETDSCPNNYKLIRQKNKCIDECKNNRNNLDLFEFHNTCVEECPNYTKIDKEANKCLESCDETKFEYHNYCLIDCPNGTYKIFTNKNICGETKPENYYYLDSRTNIYKPCHYNCLNCYGEGDENNNNCIECRLNFTKLNEPNKENNCISCQYNYYIIDNNYICTDNINCPEGYNKLIKEKNKCIDNCINDNIYQFEYNNICYTNCPKGTYSMSKNKICYDNDISFENAVQKEILNTKEYLTNGKMNGTDYLVKIGNVTIQITTSDSQKNNTSKNVSSIDLGECETKLRDIYEIDETLPLLIYKIDYFSNDSLIPIIGYEIYNPKNLSLLNLSYCSNNTIKLYIPVEIDEKNLFRHDPKSNYYTDNCNSYTTENGTDIILKDRQKEYKENNMSLCEDRCKYLGYNAANKQSSCICEAKNHMETISEIINNPNKLSNDFSENEKTSSSNMISTECTYVLFTIDGIKSNISSYLLLITIFYFLSSIILFIKCGFPLLKEDMKNIVNSKKEKKIGKISKQATKSKIDSECRIIGNNIIRIKKNNGVKSKSGKKKKKFQKILRSNSCLRNSNNKSRILKDKNKNNNEQAQNNLKKLKNKIIKKSNINFNDYELNSMDYTKAIIYDKRSFCYYYMSLLKRNHPLLFGFCPFKDYNSIIIKSCIFFLSFGIYYAINFVFFNENMIHKLYEDGGKYNILYFLPTICISFVISHFLTIIIKLIFLSDRNICLIKKQATYNEANNIYYQVEKNLTIKYIIFYIIGIIFLAIFWLFLSSFGAVFQNTQIILVKNTLFSFLISFVYPFIINILPSTFRLCSLLDKKNNSECSYKFSQFLQVIF